MARKSSKKAARPASRKPAKKPAARKAAKPAKRNASGPVPITTGRGTTPAQIASDVVQMIRARAGDAAIWAKYWHPRCDSIEGGETRMAWRGMKQIKAKSDWWTQDHAVRSAEVEGPYLGATGFAVRFKMQVETLSSGVIDTMEEIGVYTVQNGKVVREEFMGLSEAPTATEPEPRLAEAGIPAF
jgi:hypothetical protein